jgi:UDP-N-acetyl-D-mannosaminuronate dehydrogenase
MRKLTMSELNRKSVEGFKSAQKAPITVILDNVRSMHNVGSVFRTADAFLIAVPTPFKGDHEPDLSYVEAAAKSIAPVLKKGDLVILESTSPVGTTEQMSDWLAQARKDLSFPHQLGEQADVNIAYCPERVLPGKVVHEL